MPGPSPFRRWTSRRFRAYAAGEARQANIFGDNYAPIYFTSTMTPARSLAQLPRGTRDFSGRTADIADVERLIGSGEGPHIVNIYGPPGVGKSALALHVAHRLKTTFDRVQLYADLGEYNGEKPTATQILQRFVADLDPSTVNVPVGTRELPQRYRSLLAWQSCLILLDDARTTEQVADLVPGNTRSLVLVTSRVPLAAIDGVSLHQLDLMGPDESGVTPEIPTPGRWMFRHPGEVIHGGKAEELPPGVQAGCTGSGALLEGPFPHGHCPEPGHPSRDAAQLGPRRQGPMPLSVS